MLTYDRALAQLLDYLESHDERNHFINHFETGDEAYGNAKSDAPHAYVLSLYVLHKGDTDKVLKEVRDAIHEGDMEISPNSLTMIKE